MTFYTYLHCKPDGTPFYVGKGRGRRAYELATRRRNLWHQRVIAKYGKENIKVFVFECISEAQAFSDEVAQIASLRSQGYQLANFTAGGEGPSNPRQETRDRMSAAKKGKTPWLGRIHREESKKKMSLSKKGKFELSSLTRFRMSQARFGKKQSLETKTKRSIAMKAYFASKRKANMLVFAT